MTQSKDIGTFSHGRIRSAVAPGFSLGLWAGLAAALVVALSCTATARANPGPIIIHSTCDVAICDIPTELAKLRSDSQAARFKEITDLRAEYKKNTDPATLRNLLDFAHQAATLFQQLHEEDWLIREAKNLANDSLLKLAESDISDPALSGYYGQLSGEAPRFEIITYWESRVASYEDRGSLLALGAFFKAVERISVDSQDPDYLAREAAKSQDLVTQRIVELYPYFEGVYRISVACAGSGVANPACGTLAADRLVIMNSLSADGVEVTLVNHDAAVIDYRFTNAVITDSGATIEALGQPTGAVSKLHLEITDAGNGTPGQIHGWIQSGDSLSSLRIEGQLLASPGSVFAGQESQSTSAPNPIDFISHTYRGQLGGSAFTLLVRPIDENTIGASITFDTLPGDPLRFQAVRYFPKRGILVLLADVNNCGLLKFVLAFQNGTSEITGLDFGTLDGGFHALTAVPVIPPQP